MTDTTNAAGAAESPPETPESGTQPDTPPDPGQADHDGQGAEDEAPEPTPNSEAARYRVERNEARAERDQLAERLAGYQRRECESAVADLLDVPGDLFDIGAAELVAFYNDDGTLNDAELRAAAGALLEERPRLGRQPRQEPRQWGQVSAMPPAESVGWETVLRP